MSHHHFSLTARSSVLLLAAASAITALLGCSSSTAANSPPVIDDVQIPATATIGKSGNYEISGTFSAHDSDGMIHDAQILISGYTSPSIVVNKSSIEHQPFLLQVDGRSPKGELHATAKVTDDQGASASRDVSITLQ